MAAAGLLGVGCAVLALGLVLVGLVLAGLGRALTAQAVSAVPGLSDPLPRKPAPESAPGPARPRAVVIAFPGPRTRGPSRSEPRPVSGRRS